MKSSMSRVALAFSFVVSAACSSSASSSPVDAGVGDAEAPDSASPDSSMPDSAPSDSSTPDSGADSSAPAGNSWSLNGVGATGPVQCAGDLIAGSSTTRTAFQFVFKGTPTAGTYTVEPAANRAQRPTAATGVVVSFASDPVGGPKVEQVGQSGTITVDLVGGKLHAVAVAIPAKDLATMAAGTIAGNLVCP